MPQNPSHELWAYKISQSVVSQLITDGFVRKRKVYMFTPRYSTFEVNGKMENILRRPGLTKWMRAIKKRIETFKYRKLEYCWE